MPVSEALRIWRTKLEYLQQQEAIVADPAQKFALAEQINEAKTQNCGTGSDLRKPIVRRVIISSRHLPHHQIRPGRSHRPRGRDQAPHRCLGPGRARRAETPPRPHLRRARGRGKDLAGGKVGGGAGAPGLAGLRRRLRVVLLQPGHARADRRLKRRVSQGSPHLLRRPGDGGQRAGRVRQVQAAGPARRRAAGAAHPRWPGALAIRAHLTHAGRAQGPGPCRPAQRPGRHEPGALRRHHPVCHIRPARPSHRPPRPCTNCRVSRRPQG